MKFEKIQGYRWQQYAIYIAALLFPMLAATVKDGGGTIYVLLLLLGLVFGRQGWSELEAWEKKLLIGFVLFSLMMFVSLFNTQDYEYGLKKVERLIQFPLFIFMYLFVRRYNVVTARLFLIGMLAGSLVMLGQAWFQVFIQNKHEAVGAFNPLILGDVAALFAVIILASLFTVAKKWWHYFIGVTCILSGLTVSVMSDARGSWLSYFPALLLILWLNRNLFHRKGWVSVVGISAVLIGVALTWQSDKIVGRVSTAVVGFQSYLEDPNNASSIGERLNLWRDGFHIWLEHPVIGTGIGDYAEHRDQLIKDNRSYLLTRYGHAHSIYFDTLATAGSIGIIALIMAVIVFPFYIFFKQWLAAESDWIRFYSLAGMLVVLSFSIFGLTEGWLARNPFVRTYLMCILVFMSSIAVAKSTRKASAGVSAG